LLIEAVAGTKEDLPQMPKKRTPVGRRNKSACCGHGLIKARDLARKPQWPMPGTRASIGRSSLPCDRSCLGSKNAKWTRNPIDYFILAPPGKGTPQARGGRRTGFTLLRRLSLDLIGLPPTIADVDAYLADQKALTPTKSKSNGLLASPALRRTLGPAMARPPRAMPIRTDFEKDQAAQRLVFTGIG